MSKKYFAIDDITDDLIQYIDRYQRRVIIIIKGNFTVTARDPKHMVSYLLNWINASIVCGSMIQG